MLKPLKSSLFTSLSVSYIIFIPLALNAKPSYFKESQANLAAERYVRIIKTSFLAIGFHDKNVFSSLQITQYNTYSSKE